MLSPNIYQVNTGKIMKPVQDPINLADHAEEVSSATNFQAYQNRIEAGKPNNTAARTGLLFQ
jgi:hypothetical protein